MVSLFENRDPDTCNVGVCFFRMIQYKVGKFLEHGTINKKSEG